MTITANSTEYIVSIHFINDKGETKIIDKRDFNRLHFESSYFTPFMQGKLQLNNTNQQSIFQGYNMTPGGGEFIFINIEQISNPTTRQKITILSETYITQDVTVGVSRGQKVLNYYFVNMDYGPLMYTKLPWSTNNYVDNSAHKTTSEKQILVSDAIKHLLVKLYNRESNPESIIDFKNWDESSSKIEYTLKNQQPPILGLKHLISKYVSKVHRDMGILTQSGGLYRLNSLNKLLKQSGNKNYAGAIQIETGDNRNSYSNKRSIKSTFSPTHISKVRIIPQNASLGSHTIVDHSISSYNFLTSEFKLLNEEGTVNKNSYTPNSEINKPNKVILPKFEQTPDTLETCQNKYTNRIALQQKLINFSKKLDIPILGNLYLKGSKFINVGLTGIPLNEEMRDISGLWFILRNRTLLRDGKFVSRVLCGKLNIDTSPPTGGYVGPAYYANLSTLLNK